MEAPCMYFLSKTSRFLEYNNYSEHQTLFNDADVDSGYDIQTTIDILMTNNN